MCGGSMTRDDIEDIHYLVNAALCRKAHEAKIARLDGVGRRPEENDTMYGSMLWNGETGLVGAVSAKEAATLHRECPSSGVTEGMPKMVDAKRVREVVAAWAGRTRRMKRYEIAVTDADARKIPAVLNGFDVVEDRIGAPHGGGKGGGLSYWKRDADGTLLRVVMERATMDGTEVLMFRTMEKVKD